MTSLPILRHRPGRQTRMPDLAVRMEANPGSDPLIGNYILTHFQDAVIGAPLDSSYELIEVTATGQGKTLATAAAASVALSMHPGPIATGDLDGDGRDEIAVASENGPITLTLCKARETDAGVRSVTPVATVSTGCDGGTVRLATGHFLPGPAAALVIASTTGGYLRLELWGCDAELAATRISSTVTDFECGATFEIAAADVDQDGKSELAVVFTSATSSDLLVSLVSFGDAGAMTVGTPVSVDKIGGGLAIASGAFVQGSVDEQVAIAWSRDGVYVCAAVCAFEGGKPHLLATYVDHVVVTGKDGKDTNADDGMLEFSRSIAIASADLDLDGVDDLLVSYTGCLRQADGTEHHGAAVLVLLKVGAKALTCTSRGATGGAGLAHPAARGQRVGIANVGDAGTPGAIVVGAGYADFDAEMSGDARTWAAFIPIAPAATSQASPPLVLPADLVGTLSTSRSIALSAKPNAPLRLALGDFSGKSIRVGAPEYFDCDDVSNIIAILNAPPLDAGLDGLSASVSFSKHDMQSTSLGVTVHCDWSVSGQVGVQIGAGVNGSLGATYGEGFSKTEDSSSTVSESLSFTLVDDDLILLAGTHYDVWEYPIYQGAETTYQGNLLVLFPNMLGLWTDSYDGTSPDIDYFPDHQIGMLMSYSPLDPADLTAEGMVNSPTDFEIGSASISYTIDHSSGTTNSEQTHQNTSLSFNGGLTYGRKFNCLGGTNVGLNAHVGATYSFGETTTQSVSYTDSTCISISYDKIDDTTARFHVAPLVYYSTEGGFLVLDYRVKIDKTGYWAAAYPGPSIDINKPFSTEPDRTTSVTFANQDDGSGEVVITARIGNYSFATAHGVTVEFFVGNPDDPAAVRIGEPQSISAISSRTRQEVSVTWRPPSTDPVQLWIRVSSRDIPAAKQGYCPWPATSTYLPPLAASAPGDATGGRRRLRLGDRLRALRRGRC